MGYNDPMFGPVTPIIVKVIDAPTPPPSVANVILQAIGITGVLVVGATMAGVLLGGAFIGLRILRPDNPLNGDVSDQMRLNLS